MQSKLFTLGLAAGLAHAGSTSATYSVSGSCEGFAAGVTGGGDATPVIPADIEELKALLASEEPQVIVLDKTFDFVGSEGTKTETGCAPYGTGDMCQQAIDATGTWCSSDYSSVEVTYDAAATAGIEVASNKTLIGVDDKGVMLGKGLRFTNGASNIIVQNIMISNLNPQYVWGGDALTFSGADTIWVDHVTTQYLGRQHYVFGEDASHRVTLSNNFINGYTNYSASCDSYHYWAMELVGADDQITFQNNHVYHTSGRSPALSGNTLFHAINSIWEDNNGHAIEGDANGQGLFEGCVFKDVATVVADDFTGHLFGASSADLDSCEAVLGRACVANTLTGSGAFGEDDISFLANFTGLTIPRAISAAEAETNILGGGVGCGKLSSSSSSLSSSSSTESSSGAQVSSRPQASSASAPVASAVANSIGGSYGSSVAAETPAAASSGALPTASGAVYYPGPSGSNSGHHNTTTGLSPAGVSSQTGSYSTEGGSSELSGSSSSVESSTSSSSESETVSGGSSSEGSSSSVGSTSSAGSSSTDASSSAEGSASNGSDSSSSTSSASGSKSSKCKRNKKLRRSLMAEAQLQSVSGPL